MALAAADALQWGSTALANAGLALTMGGAVLPWGLKRWRDQEAVPASVDRLDWVGEVQRSAQGWLIGAWVALVLAQVGLLWWQSANMGDVPLLEAAPQLWPVLSSTHFGAAWCLGIGGVAVLGVYLALQPPRQSLEFRTAHRSLLWCGLAAVLSARAATSHAGSTGDALAFVMDLVHLGSTGLWVGIVTFAAGVVLRAPLPRSTADRAAMAGYLSALSSQATVALGLLVATGLFAGVRVLGPVEWGDIAVSRYAWLLAAKLALVVLATALGAYNRFRVLPAVLGGLVGEGESADDAKRLRTVLVIETAFLLGTLMAAALLASSAPPGAG